MKIDTINDTITVPPAKTRAAGIVIVSIFTLLLNVIPVVQCYIM